MTYKLGHIINRRRRWGPSCAFAIAAVLLGASPALASVRIAYSGRSDYVVSDIITADLDVVGGLTLDQTGQSLTAPFGSFYDPHAWDAKPRGVVLMGRRLDALGDPHLVLGVSQTYAASLIGQSFTTLYPRMNEQLVLGSLELISGNVAYDPAVQTLFDFSTMVVNDGGVFDPDGGRFTLVSFSNGRAIGSGSASLGAPRPVDSAVPEPAAWAAMTIGFCFLGGVLRRNRARSAVRGELASRL